MYREFAENVLAMPVIAGKKSEAERFAGEVVPVDTIALGKGKFAYTKRIPRGIIYGTSGVKDAVRTAPLVEFPIGPCSAVPCSSNLMTGGVLFTAISLNGLIR